MKPVLPYGLKLLPDLLPDLLLNYPNQYLPLLL